MVKNLPANAGDRAGGGVDLWVGKIPWGRKWQTPPVLLPGKCYGPRSLVGCSLRSHGVGHDLAIKQQQRFLYRFGGRNGSKETFAAGKGSACLLFKNK